jgi:hypothetical protein
MLKTDKERKHCMSSLRALVVVTIIFEVNTTMKSNPRPDSIAD